MNRNPSPATRFRVGGNNPHSFQKGYTPWNKGKGKAPGHARTKMPPKPPLEKLLSLNAALQRLRANESKQGIGRLRADRKKIPKKERFFAKYPEPVRARAKEHLSRLMVKHKDKLANRGMLAILTAVAASMALRDFKLITSSKELIKRAWAYRNVRKSLMARIQAISLEPSTTIDKLTVSRTNLDGI